MRKLLAMLLAASMLTCISATANAKPIAYLIDGDMGGALLKYEAKAKIIGGAKVIVDGVCLSACTMYLRKDWNLDVCYTESATFGFHKPYMWLPDGIATGISAINVSDASWKKFFYDQMPTGVRMMLDRKQIPEPAAGDPPDRFVFIKARDLRGALKLCTKGWSRKYKLIDVRGITIGIDTKQ